MKRIIIAAIAFTIPITAAALAPFEYGVTHSYWGRSNIIVRPASYYSPEHGPSVEIECDGYEGASAHQLMTPAEAHELAAVIDDAAVESEQQ